MKFNIEHELKYQETKPPDQAGSRSNNVTHLHPKASRFDYRLENR
jgi:hypothetical protein